MNLFVLQTHIVKVGRLDDLEPVQNNLGSLRNNWNAETQEATGGAHVPRASLEELEVWSLVFWVHPLKRSFVTSRHWLSSRNAFVSLIRTFFFFQLRFVKF